MQWSFIYIGDEDFEPDPTTSAVVLSGNETKACVNITIIDDETVEREEPFEITIIFPPDQPAIDSGEIVPPAMQINGTINIIDDDGKLMWNNIIYRHLCTLVHVCILHATCYRLYT